MYIVGNRFKRYSVSLQYANQYGNELSKYYALYGTELRKFQQAFNF